MLRFVYLVVVIIGVSCHKEVLKADLSAFEDQYLVCDSIRTITDDQENLLVKGRATGLDMKFNSKRSLTVASNPPKEYQYKIRYAKLYYWPGNVSKHEGDYFSIISYTSKKLVLKHRDLTSGNVIIYYYTAD